METENDGTVELEGVAAHEFVCPKCGLVANRFAKLDSGICADHSERVRIVPNRW